MEGRPPIERRGPPASTASSIVILLHGRNRTTEEMFAIADRIELDAIAYLALAAPGGTWYPKSFLAPIADNQPHLEAALGWIEETVRALEREGRSRREIALVGFSQGACLASEYLVRHPGRWGGLVAFTGGLIGPPGTTWPGASDFIRTPMLFVSSDVDAWVPLDRVQESVRAFRAMNASVDERIYPGMDHAVTSDGIAHARVLLERIGREPSGGA
jgi:predicted esterase